MGTRRPTAGGAPSIQGKVLGFRTRNLGIGNQAGATRSRSEPDPGDDTPTSGRSHAIRPMLATSARKSGGPQGRSGGGASLARPQSKGDGASAVGRQGRGGE